MSNPVLLIRNQHNQYLDKKNSWHSGKDSASLYQTPHHDEALNTLIEINGKDIDLRGTIIEVELDEKKRPIVDVDMDAVIMDKLQEQNKLLASNASPTEE